MSGERPPYGAAVVASALLFLLYILTLAPTTGFWDASEYIATAQTLGIPHPPGNPLFVALGKTWLTLLAPSGLSVAVRMNLFAAFTSATAAGFFFLVAHRVLRGLTDSKRIATVGAMVSTLLGGTAYTVWSQSTVNEKVYTLSVAVIAAVSWLTLRWLDRRSEPGSERLLLAAGYIMVLGSTSHLMSVLPFPAVAVVVLVAGAGVLRSRGFWIRAIPLVALGLSFNFILPIRAAEDPVINEGEPTCESLVGAAAAIYSNGAVGCPNLASSLRREQYSKPPLDERMAPFRAQLLNWFQYFDWQWSRGAAASEVPGNARLPFSLLFLSLGLIGLVTAFRTDKIVGLYLAVLAAVLTVGLVYYLNFRYGYSLYPEITDLARHEVRERDYFFLAGFMLWGVLAGIGLTWVWETIRRMVGGRHASLLASPVLIVAAIPLVLNASWAGRAEDFAPADWAYDLLMSVEPYGVLFTNGDNDTFPLWYMQEVEGVRRDVTVVVGQYLFTTWYPQQLQRLSSPGRQRPFEPDLSADLYEDRPPPEGPIVSLPPDQMDGLTRTSFAEDTTLVFPNLAVTFPAGSSFDRSEMLALAIIHDSIDERPIYFASRAGLMNQLGLGPWGVRQGLATKLELRGVSAGRPAGWVQASENLGGEWFHVDRTLALYEDIYRFRGLRDRAIWADRSTLNIPWQFYALALQLADVGAKRGMTGQRVAELQADALAFLTTASGGTVGTPETEDGT
jgi:hypothetical protein